MSLLTNIIAYYKLDGNSNESVAGNNGTDTNITYGNSYGIINEGALFNGSSSQIVLPTTLPDLNSNTAFSFSFWIKTTTSGGFISTRCDSSAHAQWNIYLDNSGASEPNISFEINPSNSGANALVCSALLSTLENGSWHNIVITYSGSRTVSGVKIYIDGVSKSITNITDTLSTNAPTGTTGAIGSRTSTFGTYYTGDIDEFGIWSRALTSTEVSQLYNGGVGLQYPFLGGGASFLFNFL